MIERVKLYEQVIDELGLRIVRGDFPVGEALPKEDQLCEELGVSRTVLREATKVLTEKGLISVTPRIGTLVRPRKDWNLLDESIQVWEHSVDHYGNFLRAVTETRFIIEPAICRLAALRATASEKEAIKANYDAMVQSVGMPKLYLAADMHFHEAILKASHNVLLEQLGNTFRQGLRVSHRITVQIADGLETALPLHRAVLEAILQGDGEAAYNTMYKLLERAWADIDQILQVGEVKSSDEPGKQVQII